MEEWIDYLVNEEAKQVLHNDAGLLAFVISGEELLITDCYIKKEFRGKQGSVNLASEAERIAKTSRCKFVTCNVFINHKNKKAFDYKIRIFTKFGFLPSVAQNNAVTMVKEIV